MPLLSYFSNLIRILPGSELFLVAEDVHVGGAGSEGTRRLRALSFDENPLRFEELLKDAPGNPLKLQVSFLLADRFEENNVKPRLLIVHYKFHAEGVRRFFWNICHVWRHFTLSYTRKQKVSGTAL